LQQKHKKLTFGLSNAVAIKYSTDKPNKSVSAYLPSIPVVEADFHGTYCCMCFEYNMTAFTTANIAKNHNNDSVLLHS